MFFTALAKNILLPLAVTAAIQKKVYRSRMTTLVVTNEEMKYIVKIVKSLKEQDLLIKCVSKTIESEVKKISGFCSMRIDLCKWMLSFMLIFLISMLLGFMSHFKIGYVCLVVFHLELSFYHYKNQIFHNYFFTINIIITVELCKRVVHILG